MINQQKKSNNDFINQSAFLWETEYRYLSKKMKGGKVSSFMGSCKVVLTDADMAENSMTVNISSVMGHIEFFIPRNWNLSLQCSQILGFVGNKTAPAGGDNDNAKTLIIKGTVLMGGLEIRS